MSFQDLYSGLKARGYVVYGCKDVLADKFLQVANMGDLGMEVIEEFLRTAAEVIAELRTGHPAKGERLKLPERISA